MIRWFSRSTLCLLLTFFSLNAQIEARQAIALHTLLIQHGFAYIGPLTEKEFTAVFYQVPGCLVGFQPEPGSRIRSGAIAFFPYHDLRAYFAFGALYVCLQDRLGKASNLDSDSLVRKGRYIFSIIRHNLAHSNTTSFDFDDLRINAKRYEEDKSILIIMVPQLY